MRTTKVIATALLMLASDKAQAQEIGGFEPLRIDDQRYNAQITLAVVPFDVELYHKNERIADWVNGTTVDFQFGRWHRRIDIVLKANGFHDCTYNIELPKPKGDFGHVAVCELAALGGESEQCVCAGTEPKGS